MRTIMIISSLCIGGQKVSVARETAEKCSGAVDFWIAGLVPSDVHISCLHCYRRDRACHIGDKGRNISLFWSQSRRGVGVPKRRLQNEDEDFRYGIGTSTLFQEARTRIHIHIFHPI